MNREKTFPISSEDIARVGAPLVRVILGERGLPVGACAASVVEADPEAVWKKITDVAGYAERVPLMDRVRLHRRACSTPEFPAGHGEWAEFHLKMKIAFFSVGFSFAADLVTEQGCALELAYRSGEPKNINIRYEIEPLADGRTLVFVRIAFDVESLGWLVKFFLRHHPEIQFGIFPGCALALLDALGGAFVSSRVGEANETPSVVGRDAVSPV